MDLGLIIQLITIISTVIFGGTSIYYRKEAKREKQLNNDGIVLNQMQAIIDEKNSSIDKLKIYVSEIEQKLKDKDVFYEKQLSECRRILTDELSFEREHTKVLRDENRTLHNDKENLLLEKEKSNIELTELRLTKCLVKNCVNRKPPTGY